MTIELTADTSGTDPTVVGNHDLILEWTDDVTANAETSPNAPEMESATFPSAVSLVQNTAVADPTSKTPRRHWSHQWVKAVAIVASDLISLAVAFVVGLAVVGLVSKSSEHALTHLGGVAWELGLFAVVSTVWFAVYGLYRQARRRLRPHAIADVGRLFHAVIAGTLVTLGAGTLIHRTAGLTQATPIELTVIGFFALMIVPLGRGACRALWHGRPSARARVLIVGSGLMADQVRRHCVSSLDLEVVGLVDDDPVPDTKTIGRIADIPRLCEDLAVDRIIVSFSRSHPAATVDQLREIHGTVPISVVPRYFELLSWRSQLDDFDGLPVIDIPPHSLSLGARFVKRSFDLVGATAVIIALSPVIAAVCTAIKFSSPGPVMFRQTRVGKDGKLFTVYKFRTMRVGAQGERHLFDHHNQSDGPLFKMSDDPRVFRVGRILRRFSLDEIPQLFNVLFGTMSLVGPRPFIPEEADRLDGWSARRLDVRPGMTGLWQVSGRNDLSATELCRLDYLYVASWSFWWDLRILWATPSVIVRALGAY